VHRAGFHTIAGTLVALPLVIISCGGGPIATYKTGRSLYGPASENPAVFQIPGFRGQSDETEFRRAQEFHTAQAYLRYLEHHPGGRHTRRARHLVERLSYLDAVAGGKPADLKAFMRKYPHSRFASSTQIRLLGVEFHEARRKDSIHAYRAFLKRHKGAPREWVSAATLRLERLLLDKAKLSGKELVLSRYIHDNPGTPYMAEAKEALRSVVLGRVMASKDEEDWLKFVRRFKGSKEARRVALHMKEERLRTAERSGSSSALERYLLLYPETPHKGRILTALLMIARNREKEGDRWVKVKMAEVEISRPVGCKECLATLRIRGTLTSVDKDFAYDVILEAALVQKGKHCCVTSYRVKGLVPGESREFSFPILGNKHEGSPPAFRLRIRKWSAYRNTPPGGVEHKNEIQTSGKKALIDRFNPVPVPSLSR